MTEVVEGGSAGDSGARGVGKGGTARHSGDARPKVANAESVFPATGLRIERIYTTAGVHPYDEVEWERRDVVMTNWRDGSINFEQNSVAFPAFWSVNAANTVTTKSFRGA